MPNVKPKGSISKLVCLDCGDVFDNIASPQLQAQGYYNYEHKCKVNKSSKTKNNSKKGKFTNEDKTT